MHVHIHAYMYKPVDMPACKHRTDFFLLYPPGGLAQQSWCHRRSWHHAGFCCSGILSPPTVHSPALCTLHTWISAISPVHRDMCLWPCDGDFRGTRSRDRAERVWDSVVFDFCHFPLSWIALVTQWKAEAIANILERFSDSLAICLIFPGPGSNEAPRGKCTSPSSSRKPLRGPGPCKKKIQDKQTLKTGQWGGLSWKWTTRGFIVLENVREEYNESDQMSVCLRITMNRIS